MTHLNDYDTELGDLSGDDQQVEIDWTGIEGNKAKVVLLDSFINPPSTWSNNINDVTDHKYNYRDNVQQSVCIPRFLLINLILLSKFKIFRWCKSEY